ncbi:carbohydrate ABC transporter permease [Allosediminivita pacifica]|uniref:Maltose ABC transporter membrane protein /trehalose ABC transporter membrane protein /sucrose ABC transporter membrane protein n=1 Tax=Allosediminivita pacifica TaxID=1267769 RepID=A0A2T6AT91_9RHOB|nr:carbohydrate ABC transporter permease [Allosediminivita pacifica]PTX46946.1 maltose ABC transporter membrane protein /trehalose ABC transporter membrane protein /sucrose ABC transporter membrane protein [Allosediminivita pacifica]GGB14994.1 alpha-glucoside ABC transporter permease [Allosediminivita pacifica]
MDNIAGKRSALTIVTHLSVLLLVIIWLVPTVGLFVSSFRDREQIQETGWWLAPFPVEQAYRVTPELEGVTREGDRWVLEGSLEGAYQGSAVAGFGITSRDPGMGEPGETVARYSVDVEEEDGEIDDTRIEITYPTEEGPSFPESDEDGNRIIPDTEVFDRSLSVTEEGQFRWEDADEITRAPSIYVVAMSPPDFGLGNYRTILSSDNMDRAFINTLTVTIPATVIPILIAAFAAYALAWMDFPGRSWLVAGVVGLLVVPLQLALVPMLTLHNQIGVGQSFLGIWMAHTGFGLPLAVYLLRNYMVGLPRDIIESAKVDGATDFQVFTKIVLPLSFPALASFAIFQFLWTWNDLLVAKVFLPSNSESWVMTVKIADDLLGSRGGDWGILAAAAFVSIAVPLGMFFAMQKYLVRGLLAGSVK